MTYFLIQTRGIMKGHEFSSCYYIFIDICTRRVFTVFTTFFFYVKNVMELLSSKWPLRFSPVIWKDFDCRKKSKSKGKNNNSKQNFAQQNWLIFCHSFLRWLPFKIHWCRNFQFLQTPLAQCCTTNKDNAGANHVSIINCFAPYFY